MTDFCLNHSAILTSGVSQFRSFGFVRSSEQVACSSLLGEMVVDGHLIGRSLVGIVAFGLALVASEQKCFEQSNDKTILKGNCKSSEVLVVTSQELEVYFKSANAINEARNLNLKFGECNAGGIYGSFNIKAVISFGMCRYLYVYIDATIFVDEEKSNTKAKIMWYRVSHCVCHTHNHRLLLLSQEKEKNKLVEEGKTHSQKSESKKKSRNKSKKAKKLKDSQSISNTQQKYENTETKGNQPQVHPLSLLKPQDKPYVAQRVSHEPPVGLLAAPLAQHDERQPHVQTSRSNSNVQLAAAQPSASTENQESRPKIPEARLFWA
ncbi:hypothetical protein M3Y98_01194700 [Aphelenchoides besseyi]|nr:hypothetical protein M3Y98_01194700 [Aphelenchoides besseyi]